MLKFIFALTLIAGLVLTYKVYNPPIGSAELLVPAHTLERLGYNEGDLFFMLSADSSCKHEFSNHNYTVMFGNKGNWRDVRVWVQHATLYLTWQDAWQLENEIHFCIRFKDKWESAWKGKFYNSKPFKRLFCNKENSSLKWECIDYKEYYDKKGEIYKLLKKYNEPDTPNK